MGGSVRDALLAAEQGTPRVPGDLDVTTDARPEQVLELLRGWAGSTWNTGIAFGTVGAEVSGVRLEITTYRADRYDRESRNPEVAWGASLVDDLVRRDFTVNAMAVSLGPDRTVTDPFGGLGDLIRRRLRTPGSAVDSFADDPLRMLRAVRFVAQLGLAPVDEVVEAMTAMSGELARITPERVQVELSKTLLQDAPRAALELFVDHRPGRRRPARARRPADGDRRAPPAQGRLHALPDGAGPGDRPGEGRSGGTVPRPRPAPRRAAARHREAGHPPAPAAGPRLLPPPRGGRGQAGAQAADRPSLSEGRRRGGLPADLPAPALPRVRRRGVDRLRRPSVRDRCR